MLFHLYTLLNFTVIYTSSSIPSILPNLLNTSNMHIFIPSYTNQTINDLIQFVIAKENLFHSVGCCILEQFAFGEIHAH